MTISNNVNLSVMFDKIFRKVFYQRFVKNYEMLLKVFYKRLVTAKTMNDVTNENKWNKNMKLKKWEKKINQRNRKKNFLQTNFFDKRICDVIADETNAKDFVNLRNKQTTICRWRRWCCEFVENWKEYLLITLITICVLFEKQNKKKMTVVIDLWRWRWWRRFFD